MKGRLTVRLTVVSMLPGDFVNTVFFFVIRYRSSLIR